MPPKPPVIVITGPTSSGKSDLAIQLARNFSGWIISADSRQIYQTMDIGTGKVEGHWEDLPSIMTNDTWNALISNSKNSSPIKERSGLASVPSSVVPSPSEIFRKNHAGKIFVSEGIPHFLLDFVSPQEKGGYNITQFQTDCQWLIKKAHQNNKLPIICGGTGFWIKAVTQGSTLPPVPPDWKLRASLEERSTEELFETLQAKDSRRARTIDPHNRARLIRALEICQTLGRVPTPEENRTEKTSREFDFLQFVIAPPQEVLEEKIYHRLDSRWQAGMIKEVERLKKELRLSWKEIQSFGLAYHWIPLYLQDKIDQGELRQRVYWAERNYAKRQLTWFRKQKDLIWENDREKIFRIVREFN
jgi:tRNA dimethylallyltransferase